MAKSIHVRKIMWAVDAFQEDKVLFKKAIEFLKDFDSIEGIEIEPVYVLSSDQLNLPVEFSPPWIEQYKPAAEKSLNKLLEKTGLKSLKKPTILLESRSSLSATLETFTEYAKKQKADFALVSSHSRKGVKRFFMGSFAESFLLESKIPVIVIGPKTKIASKLNHIFFATDFSDVSKKSLGHVIEFAKELEAKITFYHVIPNPIEPVVQSGIFLLGGSWVNLKTHLASEIKKQKELAKSWIDECARGGVKATSIIDIAKKQVASEIVDEAVRKKASVIAVIAKSGAVASTLIGSVSRQVAREAPVPVWTIRER